MQRVLDIDLDFLVQDVVYWPNTDVRPDPTEHPAWPTEDALGFLTERCGLSRAGSRTSTAARPTGRGFRWSCRSQ